jgi:hypothetical protein
MGDVAHLTILDRPRAHEPTNRIVLALGERVVEPLDRAFWLAHLIRPYPQAPVKVTEL